MWGGRVGDSSRVRKGYQVKTEEEEAVGPRRATWRTADGEGVMHRMLLRTWSSKHLVSHTK